MKKSTIYLAAMAFVSLCLLNGCSSKGELIDENQQAEAIYKQGKTSIKIGDFKTAIEIFEKLESLYPFSKYSVQSQLDLMYAYYRFNEGDSAIAQADNFIRFNPTHPQMSYILYMKGVIQQNDRKGLFHKWVEPKREEHDISSLKEAYNSFNQLIQRFPNSPYSADAKQRMIYINNTIAENEWKIADFYLGRFQYIAASNRAKQVIQNFPETPAARKALVTMQKAYEALDMQELANNIQRIIDIN